MKICTCNKCDRIYEDLDPGKNSIEYPFIDITPLTYRIIFNKGKIVDKFWACPTCYTDAYLTNNIKEDAEEIHRD
jgi:hypothetical protein